MLIHISYHLILYPHTHTHTKTTTTTTTINVKISLKIKFLLYKKIYTILIVTLSKKVEKNK